ncbi:MULTISPECIES: DUF1800 domain-containing protein [Rhizobium]|uniref:Uncharacterized protein (DUF1800 family) n=1 Tax=Rhizobium paranaense TaxID=1650438 RepID=A0A7W8XRM1_9HYPH|nr:DUF1800 domain-containing protein [Rhizobium paranaense]MBB5574315.1 uncharacterized protein (DUF1800 family) [Rhizobium paranaense]
MSLSFQTMAALRFGYGFRPGETPPANKDALLDPMRIGDGNCLFPVGGIEARRQAIRNVADRLRDIRSSDIDDDAKRDEQKAIFKELQQSYQRDADARIAQAVFSPNGFYERLAVFWTNHFSVSVDKAQPMKLIVPLFEAEAIRPRIGGTFPDLLRSATQHPAMLIYLDQTQSLGPNSPAGIKRGKGLNENLARELLELHTLGAGSGYTQDDVRSAAMVLTGITVDRQSVEVDFRKAVAEPGSHQVLGVNYGRTQRSERDCLQMLDDLALNPKTAAHISRKLALHFISDTPPQAMIDAMTQAWRKTDGDLMAVYGAMLDHPTAWTNEGSKARQPFDFVVAGLRALDLPRNAAAGAVVDPLADDEGAGQATADDNPPMPSNSSAIPGKTTDPPDPQEAKRRQAAIDATFYAPRGLGVYALQRMGQPVWRPPSPAGFPEGFDAWINAGELSERISWARRAIGRYGKQYDPRQFLKETLADAARDDTIRVVSQAPNKMTGLTLAFASPEFNRR